MKFKLKGSTNLLKIVLALGISISLWNCEKEDYEVTTTNPHASHEEYKKPFEKIKYNELVNDNEFSEKLSFLEKHSNKLILKKQFSKGKTNSNKKIKLSIVQNEVIRIESNNTITWTFELERNLFKDTDYENLLIKKYNNTYTYHLIAYFNTKNKAEQENGRSYSFEIPEEKLDLDELSLASRGDVFDWASPDDGGGGIDTSDPCEGVWIPEYKQCDAGGNADGHRPALQFDGSYCSGSDFIGYIIDFSHCETGTYDPPSGPSNGSTDPADPGPTTGGGGSSSNDSGSTSNGGSNDGETLVTSPIPPDKDGKCGEGYIKNPVTGECESICKGGKIYDPITKNCNCPDGKKEDSNGNCVDYCDTTKRDLKSVFTNMSDSKASTLAYVINNKGADFGIDTKEKLNHFLAQAGHEVNEFSSGLSRTESFYYTTQSRLKKVFKKYFWQNNTDTINKRNPAEYIQNSSKLANYVYCCRMGNGNEASGDGYKYRGRGIFQLTGKNNYEAFNNWYNSKYSPKDFINNPSLITSNDTISILSAMWFYKTQVMDQMTINSSTTVKSITRKVNGGKNGLTHRTKIYNKAKESITCK